MIHCKSLSGVKPLNNQVLLKKDPIYDSDESITSSGIIVLNKNKPKDRYALATIIKLGSKMKTPEGQYRELSDIWSEGDRVFYYVPAQGLDLEIEGEMYFLIRAEDILQAVVEDE